jgi:hypothetical protein
MLDGWSPLTTRYLIAGIFVALIVLDVILAACIGNEATLSKQMQRLYLSWPIIAVAYGGLGAHFFVAKHDIWPGWWEFLKPALCLLTGFIAFLVAWQQSAPEIRP